MRPKATVASENLKQCCLVLVTMDKTKHKDINNNNDFPHKLLSQSVIAVHSSRVDLQWLIQGLWLIWEKHIDYNGMKYWGVKCFMYKPWTCKRMLPFSSYIKLLWDEVDFLHIEMLKINYIPSRCKGPCWI